MSDNKKELEFLLDASGVSYIGNSYDSDDNAYDLWYFHEEDSDYYNQYPYDWQAHYTYELAQNRIKSSNREIIRLFLSGIGRNHKRRPEFESIIAGPFYLKIEGTTLLADKYFLETITDYGTAPNYTFSLVITELDDTEECLYINPVEDVRFKMAKWTNKFEDFVGVGKNLTLDEVVEIIAHCVRIARASSFF